VVGKSSRCNELKDLSLEKRYFSATNAGKRSRWINHPATEIFNAPCETDLYGKTINLTTKKWYKDKVALASKKNANKSKRRNSDTGN
jgi:hypothetical protein